MGDGNYQVSFVPKRLEIDGRPELNHFSVNVLFAGAWREGNQEIHYSVYLPDFLTYTEGDKNQGMEYYNAIDRNWWLWISRNKESGYYIGFKYRGRNTESIGGASGMNYEAFFRFFTGLGIKK